MITISVILGLYMVISLIMVTINYSKNPKDGWDGVMGDSRFFICFGAFLGLVVIPTVLIVLAVIYLP